MLPYFETLFDSEVAKWDTAYDKIKLLAGNSIVTKSPKMASIV